MATPLLLMASNDPTRQEATNTLIGSEETKRETGKQRGKRSSKSKSPSQKKQPQRGMGVAQLERLRLQERWKKMTETNPLHSLNNQNQFQYQIPYSFANPSTGISNYGTAINGGDQSGLSRVLMLQRIGSGGFHGIGGGSGLRGLVSDQVQVDPYRTGVSDPSFRIGNIFETSKELTSMPKMQCVSDQCDVCLKKPIDGEHFGFNGGTRDNISELSPINGCDLLELNLGNNRNINGEIRDFSTRPARRASFNIDEEVEVMAIHRKGNAVGGSVLMEYEFFPAGKVGRSTSKKESKLYAEASEAIFKMTAASTATCSSDTDASNSVDLSLKLSF